VRVDFDISYRQDLFSDFYLRFSFYDQYDSKPPEGASDNDFGTTIAVGWDW
jgi:putative salt-induced outer membrane protein YdiY